jgi:DNA topoisomerase 2-associated protein PAT1
MWGAAPRSGQSKDHNECQANAPAVRPPPPPAGRQAGPPPMGQIKTLEEIEAEMTAMDFQDARGPAAPPTLPTQPQVRSLEEIEREMLGDEDPVPFKQPSREETPVQLGLDSSGYAKQQALLDNMFPLPGQGQPQPMGQSPGFQGQGGQQGQGIDNEQRAREYHAKQERIAAKIQAMSTYNNCMGSSDKDFITRIQLSQLATADPYTSDFYAQVYTQIQKSRQRGPEESEGPTVVKVGQDAGFGVGGASGNRFGQMGNKTMQKLSSQVKKLVEQRKNKQMSNGQ